MLCMLLSNFVNYVFLLSSLYILILIFMFLATDTEVSGSIPGATRFSE